MFFFLWIGITKNVFYINRKALVVPLTKPARNNFANGELQQLFISLHWLLETLVAADDDGGAAGDRSIRSSIINRENYLIL